MCFWYFLSGNLLGGCSKLETLINFHFCSDGLFIFSCSNCFLRLSPSNWKKQKNMELQIFLMFLFVLNIAKGWTLTQRQFFHGKIQWKWCFWSFLSGNLGGGSKLETFLLIFLFSLTIFIVSWNSRQKCKKKQIKNGADDVVVFFWSYLMFVLRL